MGGSFAAADTSLLRDLGCQPVVADISEFQKLEGCVTCLSVRLRSLPLVANRERDQS
jgi:dimethylargininase